MFNPSIMTEHGGWPVQPQPGRGLPPLTLSDFREAWGFPDAPSMVAAWQAQVQFLRDTEQRGSHG
jgi:hypothetical protein